MIVLVEEGEGKPVEFLLGMTVHQDLLAGTISVEMSMAIDKLARGILTPEELIKSRGVHYPISSTPLLRLSVSTSSQCLVRCCIFLSDSTYSECVCVFGSI